MLLLLAAFALEDSWALADCTNIDDVVVAGNGVFGTKLGKIYEEKRVSERSTMRPPSAILLIIIPVAVSVET